MIQSEDVLTVIETDIHRITVERAIPSITNKTRAVQNSSLPSHLVIGLSVIMSLSPRDSMRDVNEWAIQNKKHTIKQY